MKPCLYCQQKYTPGHGNQQYCSAECKKLQKAATQKKLYGVLKELRAGFLSNYKLLERLLPKVGKKTFALTELSNSGFKVDCYYKAYTDNNKTIWYRVGDYSFAIEKNNEGLFITITNK